jgi:hypothetical protein
LSSLGPSQEVEINESRAPKRTKAEIRATLIALEDEAKKITSAKSMIEDTLDGALALVPSGSVSSGSASSKVNNTELTKEVSMLVEEGEKLKEGLEQIEAAKAEAEVALVEAEDGAEDEAEDEAEDGALMTNNNTSASALISAPPPSKSKEAPLRTSALSSSSGTAVGSAQSASNIETLITNINFYMHKIT